jgi:F0F1-type ATP synthase membrane subunit b/b'
MEQILKTFDLNLLDAQMIVVWAVVFTILWQLLSKLVFKRFLHLVELRDAATSGAKENAEKKIGEANSLTVQIEDRLAEVRVTAMKQKLQELSAARTHAQQLTDEAERKAQQSIESARRELKDRLVALRQELEKDTEAMARSVVASLKTPSQIEAR